MKLTTTKLKQIIKEELNKVMKEGSVGDKKYIRQWMQNSSDHYNKSRSENVRKAWNALSDYFYDPETKGEQAKKAINALTVKDYNADSAGFQGLGQLAGFFIANGEFPDAQGIKDTLKQISANT